MPNSINAKIRAWNSRVSGVITRLQTFRNVASWTRTGSGAGGRYERVHAHSRLGSRWLYTDVHDVIYDLQFKRDELQTEMIAETHRKRRQLDRERRALERPQPSMSTHHIACVLLAYEVSNFSTPHPKPAPRDHRASDPARYCQGFSL